MIYDLVDVIFELIKAIVIALLPIIVVRLFEYIFLQRKKHKENKETVFYDIIRLILIYIFYPLMVFISLIGSIIQDINLLEYLKIIRGLLFFWIKIYIFFCIAIIGLYGLNKCKIIHFKLEICNNIKIVIINAFLLLAIIISYYFHKNIEAEWAFKELTIFRYYMLIYVSAIPLIVLCVFIYFTRKLIFIRKRVIGYGKHRGIVWLIVYFPLILELLIIEFILYKIVVGRGVPLVLTLFIMIFLVLVDINIVYIFRPRYVLKKEILYELTLKNGCKFLHINSMDYKAEMGIIELRKNAEIYFIKVEDIQKIQEYKEQLYSLTRDNFCKTKCALLWMIEIALLIGSSFLM